MFQDLSKFKELGFSGFKTVEQLWNGLSDLPNERGIYIILNPDCTMKQFMVKGVGGYFKDKDPNISLSDLNSKWVDGCSILYIGQAGGNGSSATLRKRIKQYLNFGQGKPVGHYGGRLIWQLAHYKNLIVAWKITPNSDPREEEKLLMKDFYNFYGRLPFANLTF